MKTKYDPIKAGDLLQENDEIFGYCNIPLTPSGKEWSKIPNNLVGRKMPFNSKILRRPIKEAPSPTEPVEFRQHYISLEGPDFLQDGDEVFDPKTGKWNTVTEIAGNTPYNWPTCTFRRKVPTYSPAMA
jgi:hypothetical protein